ncbi:MAG TPA: lysine biosynthesis protein LysX [Candidatus Bathyarchaeota archaeon]|nr:lysine biosynthesis protein LysX [Candidatus Bathyarchaeota archaeon]
MTTISLISDRIRWDEKALINAASRIKVDLKLIDPKCIFINVSEGLDEIKDSFGDVAINRCVSYFRGLHITAILEKAGLEVINPFNVSLICGNKVFTNLALMEAGVPIPKTLLAFTRDGALKALDEIGFPAVMKPVIGSWGRLIALVKDRDSAQAIIESREQIHNALLQIYYVQEYVNRPPRDIRVLVIGDEAVAASYRYSPKDDWRTNVARGGVSKPCRLTDDLVDLALRAAKAVGGGVLAVDCMESPSGILVHEVNSTVEFRGLCSATQVDIPGKIIEYAVRMAKR